MRIIPETVEECRILLAIGPIPRPMDSKAGSSHNFCRGYIFIMDTLPWGCLGCTSWRFCFNGLSITIRDSSPGSRIPTDIETLDGVPMEASHWLGLNASLSLPKLVVTNPQASHNPHFILHHSCQQFHLHVRMSESGHETVQRIPRPRI